MNAVKESDSTKKNIYIFDETHNFIKNVYNNMITKTGKRALTIYDYIIQDKKENDSTRIILLSGTPAVNKPRGNLYKGYDVSLGSRIHGPDYLR